MFPGLEGEGEGGRDEGVGQEEFDRASELVAGDEASGAEEKTGFTDFGGAAAHMLV